MVKSLKDSGLWNWRGLVLGITQAAIIGLFVWMTTAFTEISKGANQGNRSIVEIEKLSYQVDSLKKYNLIQEQRSLKVENDIDWIKQALIRIEDKVDKK